MRDSSNSRGEASVEAFVSSPLRLILLKHNALGVVTNHPRLDETAQVELLRPEHRHGGRFVVRIGREDSKLSSSKIVDCFREGVNFDYYGGYFLAEDLPLAASFSHMPHHDAACLLLCAHYFLYLIDESCNDLTSGLMICNFSLYR